jgi:exonuclease III
MLHTYKIATLNINGIASHTKMSMLDDFLKRQDIDVALLQEVTHTDFTTIHGYKATVNEGTDKRGTAFLVKTGLDFQHIKRIPSGRGIAAMFQGIRIINIYAPSGAEKRVERECFFNNDVTFLLPTDSTDVVIAGDFNCVTSPADCTGRPTTSRALMTLIKVIGLCDVWETHPHNPNLHTLHQCWSVKD